MKKYLISFAVLVLLAGAGVGFGFALTGGGSDGDALVGGSSAGDPVDGQPVPSDGVPDPGDCGPAGDSAECGDVLEPIDLPDAVAGDQYRVTVRFNESVTQDEVDETGALLRAHDPDIEYVIMESFPPSGSAVLTSDDQGICELVADELARETYVDTVDCAPWQPPDVSDPDAPVTNPNEGTAA